MNPSDEPDANRPGFSPSRDVAEAKPTHRRCHLLRDILETLLLALVALCILRLAFQNYKVQGPSMEPTLRRGQFLLVWKLAYTSHPVQRGDHVVLRSVTKPARAYIKRVIGLPGERVESCSGEVCINGVPVNEPYDPTPSSRS